MALRKINNEALLELESELAMSCESMSVIPSFDRQCRRLRDERELHDGAWFVGEARADARRANWRNALVLIALAIVLAFCLSGCATIPETNNALEIGWQAEHVVDTLQTVHGAASDRCYYEADPVTRALIGEKPSRGAVYAWGVGYGAFHYGVTRLLEKFAPEWVATVWEAASIADTTVVIGHNYSVGIRLGAKNRPANCDLDDKPQMLPGALLP